MNSYTVQPNDTLSKISARFYGRSDLARRIADYNGIRNPDLIYVGAVLQIPGLEEIEGPATPVQVHVSQPVDEATPPAAGPASPVKVAIRVPDGLPQIIAAFGDIYQYLRPDGSISPKWETEILGRAKLPAPLPLSWDLGTKVSAFPCHKKLEGVFTDVFAALYAGGLWPHVKTYGGCYNFRTKRSNAKLSTHSWGIAVDLNVATNQMGTKGDMHPGVVEVFRKFGFKWGGDWTGRGQDPMHFQFCTGY